MAKVKVVRKFGGSWNMSLTIIFPSYLINWFFFPIQNNDRWSHSFFPRNQKFPSMCTYLQLDDSVAVCRSGALLWNARCGAGNRVDVYCLWFVPFWVFARQVGTHENTRLIWLYSKQQPCVLPCCFTFFMEPTNGSNLCERSELPSLWVRLLLSNQPAFLVSTRFARVN